MTELELTRTQYLELEKLCQGAFQPVTGFMTEDEFLSVSNSMRLPDGQVFPLPIVLQLSADAADRIKGLSRVSLLFDGVDVGELSPLSQYRPDMAASARKIYGTDERVHPGVRFFMDAGDVFVGGPVRLKDRSQLDFSEWDLTPVQTRSIFQERGWTAVAGFQTRNIPHRGHEYLQRIALEICDGLFIQPLVGQKKEGDFAPAAIMAAYRTLVDEFYPAKSVVLGILSTAMRYAGPREAVFHAIIRRNYGCSHFIVGRDHAGVGDYYGQYAAHDLLYEFETELGISIIPLENAYHCDICDSMATEKSCSHGASHPEAVRSVSGTDMRGILSGGSDPDPRLMRPEIVRSVRGMDLFVRENEL